MKFQIRITDIQPYPMNDLMAAMNTETELRDPWPGQMSAQMHMMNVHVANICHLDLHIPINGCPDPGVSRLF